MNTETSIIPCLGMSDADRCFPFPQAYRFENGGIINLALFLIRSLIRNPLSAIISSPGRIRSKHSQFHPPPSFGIYVMTPDGEIHTRALKVLCCLYELMVWDWAVGFLGFLI